MSADSTTKIIRAPQFRRPPPSQARRRALPRAPSTTLEWDEEPTLVSPPATWVVRRRSGDVSPTQSCPALVPQEPAEARWFVPAVAAAALFTLLLLFLT